MGAPAAVMGDRITGTCVGHAVPSASGASPAPPLPFSAPVDQQLARTVMIGGQPAAVVGSAGTNTPPHVGLHATDPHAAPLAQRGVVTGGSATVLFDGQPAARSGSPCTICFGLAGQLAGTAASVRIGG